MRMFFIGNVSSALVIAGWQMMMEIGDPGFMLIWTGVTFTLSQIISK